jgi:predicted nucleotidyltransferase
LNPLYEALKLTISKLAGSKYALVGGLAISVRAEPRFTRDVDLAIAVETDTEAESIAGGLIRAGFSPLAGIEQTATSRLATVRLVPPNGKVIVDLLFASSGIEPEIARAAETLEIATDIVVPVAQIWHLMAMKTLAYSNQRKKDLLDLEQLLAVSRPEDLDKARESLQLIQERGFSRGKNLLQEFDDHLKSFRQD